MKNQNVKWDKKMTIAEMLPLMADAEIIRNARRGGVAAIEEKRRRRAPPSPEMGAGIPGARHSYADRILPDHELDIGV